MTQVIDSLGEITGFGYDPNGNLLSVTDARQNAIATPQSTVYAYDSMDRLETRTDPLGLPESYQYDENGNLIQFTNRKGQVTNFQYDALNRKIFAGFGAVGAPGLRKHDHLHLRCRESADTNHGFDLGGDHS